MGRCEVCGNEYEMAFQVITAGVTHTFDCFECAAHKLAPICEHCGCKILGHGMEAQGRFFCCAHCARMAGATELADRSDAPMQSRTQAPATGARAGTRAPMQAGAPMMESWRGSGLAEDIGVDTSRRTEDDVEDARRGEKFGEAEEKLGFTDPE